MMNCQSSKVKIPLSASLVHLIIESNGTVEKKFEKEKEMES